jgi:hypothetical protein
VEDVAGAVVDVHLAHPGAFHHGVKRAKILDDEFEQVIGSYSTAALGSRSGMRPEPVVNRFDQIEG